MRPMRCRAWRTSSGASRAGPPVRWPPTARRTARPAADKLCQSKGFKEGKSLDIDTARNCSARALLSGRKPEESECRTENYVTRAVCQ